MIHFRVVGQKRGVKNNLLAFKFSKYFSYYGELFLKGNRIHKGVANYFMFLKTLPLSNQQFSKTQNQEQRWLAKVQGENSLILYPYLTKYLLIQFQQVNIQSIGHWSISCKQFWLTLRKYYLSAEIVN